jgi:hypothetical protein
MKVINSRLLLMLTAAVLLACGGQERTATDTMASDQSLQSRGDGARLARRSAEMDMAASRPPAFVEAARMKEGAAMGRGGGAPEAQELPQIPTGMIIRNGAVTVRVDSLEVAIDAVRNLARSLGGYVGDITTQMGEYQIRSATLQLKVPATRFDSAMTGMPAFGKVEHSSSTAQDVGEEFVDVTARVANAKRLEDRLVRLLATRTGKLEDVLMVERELARVRQEIERYEGRLRYLRTHVATSTIVATVHEKAPLIVAAPGPNVFTRAFVNMWRNFVRFLTTGIELMGVLVPVAALFGLVWFALRRWVWRRPDAPPSVPPEPSRA